jgi:porin
VTFEANRVLSGGLVQHTTAHALYDLNMGFDLQRIAGWKDAHVGVEAYVVDGHNPSQDVGDFQSFSDFSARELAQVAQVYYEQWFGDRSWRIKLGKMDANSDFAAPGGGTESIHSGTFYSPTIFTMVVYPDPATGIVAGWAPDENWSVNVGMYDGATMAGVATGGLGPATFFGDPPGFFYIGEVGRRWKAGSDALVGGASVGAWTHTGEFADAFGAQKHGTSGFYGSIDQEFSHAAEGESGGTTAGLLQIGFADPDVAPLDSHLGLGFRWAGACAARPDDVLGLYVSSAHFSRDAGFGIGSETAYELCYRFQICEGFALRPDLQFISNPGGDPTIDDALVFSLRCDLSF